MRYNIHVQTKLLFGANCESHSDIPANITSKSQMLHFELSA